MRCSLPLLAAIFFCIACEKAEPLPRYWPIPEFTLTAQDGQPYSSRDLHGKIWVADFFFVNCPGICSALSANMARLHRELREEAEVEFVSITTDPVADTPQVLAAYAMELKADKRWHFLTGEKPVIWNLCQEGFKLSVVDSPSGPEPITHSSRLTLVDRAGVVRGPMTGWMKWR